MKYIAMGWSAFIDQLKNAGYEVDSADKRQYSQWITLYKNGLKYSAEVTKYSDGDYELQSSNISKVNTKDSVNKIYNPVTKMMEEKKVTVKDSRTNDRMIEATEKIRKLSRSDFDKVAAFLGYNKLISKNELIASEDDGDLMWAYKKVVGVKDNRTKDAESTERALLMKKNREEKAKFYEAEKVYTKLVNETQKNYEQYISKNWKKFKQEVDSKGISSEIDLVKIANLNSIPAYKQYKKMGKESKGAGKWDFSYSAETIEDFLYDNVFSHAIQRTLAGKYPYFTKVSGKYSRKIVKDSKVKDASPANEVFMKRFEAMRETNFKIWSAGDKSKDDKVRKAVNDACNMIDVELKKGISNLR